MRFTIMAAVLVLALAGAVAPGCSAREAEAFRTVTSEQAGALMSAWIAPDGVAYLAGGKTGVTGSGASLLLRWDGRSVVEIPTPDARAFWWIHGISATEIYLAGEAGEVHRFDGETLTRIDAGAPADSILFGIWGPSGDELWTVGGSFVTGGPRRVIRRLTGGLWSGVETPAGVDAEITYFKVWGASASDVWIVGDLGVVLRDQGAGLARVGAPGAERYVTVYGCGPRDVYAVGGGGSGAAFHFDGGGFVALALLDVPLLNGVTCADGVAYVGGFFAYAARLRGQTPQVIAMPRDLTDLGIHGLAAGGGRVLAVGGDLVATGGSPRRGFAVELDR